MTLVAGIFIAHGARCRILEKILAVRVRAGVTVGMRIHKVAPDTENLFLAHIEVHTERLGRSNAVGTSEATETPACSIGKARLVDIVGRAEEGNLVAVPKTVYGEVGLISVVCAISGLGIAEPAVVHAFLHREVYHGFLLAVVNAGHSGKVALAVHHLQLLDDVYRQVSRGHRGVVAEKLFAVNKYLAYFLSVGRNLAVAAHLHAGKTLKQVFDHGVGLRFVRFGGELHGVFHHLHRGAYACDSGFLQGYGAFGKCKGLDGARGIAHIELAGLGGISHIRCLDYILAGLDVDAETSLSIGYGSLHHG